MPLIDKTYFIGELNIPNTDRPGVYEPLNQIIAVRERELLTDLFGYEMYKDLLANPTDERWLDIVTGKEYTHDGRLHNWPGLYNAETKESLIANYVYYWYMRNSHTMTTGTGEAKPVSENATVASPADKMVKAWNAMSDQIRHLFHFMYYNPDVYNDWDYNARWSIHIDGFYGWHNPWYYGRWKYGYINSLNA